MRYVVKETYFIWNSVDWGIAFLGFKVECNDSKFLWGDRDFYRHTLKFYF